MPPPGDQGPGNEVREASSSTPQPAGAPVEPRVGGAASFEGVIEKVRSQFAMLRREVQQQNKEANNPPVLPTAPRVEVPVLNPQVVTNAEAGVGSIAQRPMVQPVPPPLDSTLPKTPSASPPAQAPLTSFVAQAPVQLSTLAQPDVMVRGNPIVVEGAFSTQMVGNVSGPMLMSGGIATTPFVVPTLGQPTVGVMGTPTPVVMGNPSVSVLGNTSTTIPTTVPTPGAPPPTTSIQEAPSVLFKWTPKGNKTTAQAKVLMVRDESQGPLFGQMAMNPILMSILGQMGQPKFSGNRDDWPQFAKDWQEYVRILTSFMPGGGFPDVLLLQALKGCVDEATKRELQRLMEKDPQLTYALFWAQLQQDFEGDTNLQHRAAWERVVLDPQAPLTAQTWRQFCTEFVLKGQRVEDKGDGEDYKLIFKQLPPEWRREADREGNKRKSKQFCV